jgi:hypothetical protein
MANWDRDYDSIFELSLSFPDNEKIGLTTQIKQMFRFYTQ